MVLSFLTILLIRQKLYEVTKGAKLLDFVWGQ